MLRQLVFAAAVSVASFGFAETLGFWNFRDGEPGADVSTVANSSGTASYTSATAQKSHATNGQLPKFNADSPGRIFSGKQGELLCANPQSIDFRYVSRDTRQSGYIDLDGVADDISGKGSFTIEYFFKMDPDYVYWKSGDIAYANYSKTMLYLESRTDYGAFKVITPNSVGQDAAGHGKDVRLEVYKHDPVAAGGASFSGDLCDGKWHHIAVVYTETDALAKTGNIVFYYDRSKAAAVTYLNDPAGTTGLKLRIGSGYRNQDGADKTGTESVNASISALRVSNAALTADDFLQVDTFPDIADMGTAAFYPFNDGVVGETVGTVTNAVSADLMPGVAAKTWNGGTTAGELPKFAADVPAKHVYSDASRTTLLTDNYQSLYFRPVQDYSMGGGRVDFEAASTLAHRLDAFTFEYFFKIPADQTHTYRTPFGYRIGETEDLKVNLPSSSAATGYGTYTVEVRATTTGSDVATFSSVSKPGANLGYGWHHAAFVHTKADYRTDVYLDGSKVGSVYYTNHIGIASFPFRFGSSDRTAKAITEACGGYFACPRLSTSALAADQFMVASDLPIGTVFAIDFNDGEGRDGQTFVTGNTTTGNKVRFPSGEEFMSVTYGLHAAAYPQFTEGKAARADRMISWGTEQVWNNLAGCHFLGYGSLPNGTANRQYAGTELCVLGSSDPARNPASWTMEAFVKPEYDNLDNMLLFGKAAVGNQHANPRPYPEYCWMLLRHKSGMLELRWTEQAADPSYQYTVDSKDYYKAVLTPTAIMKDHRWYHVALTYDKPTKTFKLYIDYKLVLTQATSGLELFESMQNYYFSRINAANGFEGWMDEIRFSDSALEPAAFESIEKLGMILFCR